MSDPGWMDWTIMLSLVHYLSLNIVEEEKSHWNISPVTFGKNIEVSCIK